ncbi:hypothetical protein SAMN05444392_10116 [Seinonella peptonophila]|uniref:Uncharacterized protein n=1 Tax=Seinonella peptonophila TaxID=112248 RepID=A0A1M4SK43_9BACL|nr:hypothetical protein SAMN05444392_10116 [Seinonella peptonophila]
MANSVPMIAWIFYVIIPVVGMVITIATSMYVSKKDQKQ